MFRYFIVFALDETRYEGRGEGLFLLWSSYLQAADFFFTSRAAPPPLLKKEEISLLVHPFKE